MESSTEILRKLLDERGVEWTDKAKEVGLTLAGFADTRWNANGVMWLYAESNGTATLASSRPVEIRGCTPEQAIAATLGGEDKSRWNELFGTPERAARAMVDMCEGGTFDDCGGCPAALAECKLGDYDALLEWLRGDA